MRLGEVILNRYLKEYTQKMINDICNKNKMRCCPVVFGYGNVDCKTCSSCYNQDSQDKRIKVKRIDEEDVKRRLFMLCKEYEINYRPTKEIEGEVIHYDVDGDAELF